MKYLLCALAMLSLATTGCTGGLMGQQRGGILASRGNNRNSAARPLLGSHQADGVQLCSANCDVCCEPGCGCGMCCEPACGCDVCCEPQCGCDPCCEPGCGVYDPCCTDGCSGDGCSGGNRGLFGNGGLFGKGGRNGNGDYGNGGFGNGGRGGLANGGICSRCGDPNCTGCLGGGLFGHCHASGICPHSGGYPEYPAFNPGPPVGQVAYPYYTTRGPRDFLQNNPPSIGPY